jgi:hypothetical protein
MPVQVSLPKFVVVVNCQLIRGGYCAVVLDLGSPRPRATASPPLVPWQTSSSSSAPTLHTPTTIQTEFAHSRDLVSSSCNRVALSVTQLDSRRAPWACRRNADFADSDARPRDFTHARPGIRPTTPSTNEGPANHNLPYPKEGLERQERAKTGTRRKNQEALVPKKGRALQETLSRT